MDDSRKRSGKHCLQGKSVLRFILSCSLLPSVLSAQTPVYFGSPWRGSPFIPPQIPLAGSPFSSENHEFSLRHIFHRGTHEHPDLHQRLDIDTDTRLLSVSEDGQVIKPATLDSPLVASSNPITIERLADRRLSVIEGYQQNARSTGRVTVLSPSEWVMDSVDGPNVKDKASVRTFAEMTANDYVEEPGTGKWHDINGRFNYSSSFGWQNDGLRGHIYADKTNSTVVISLKGTSPALFDGAGTTTNDKLNDNLFFSCCCGQGGSYLWREACDCQKSTYNANLTCIIEAMNDENRYYRASMDLYSNVTELYPDSNIWLVGHSLGGAMSSLLGLTFGLPVVSFEAIPDALPASRLGLPIPPDHDSRSPQKRRNTGSYHFGHTADPIYTGTCNGVGATCTWGGYALESACHTGEMCTYDTVKDKGWRVAIGTHRIESVLTDVLDVYDEVPPCVAEEECYDCELWKFFRSNGSETTSTTTITSTTSPTPTRTSTCKTPGWWGCLDESTTTTGTTTASTPTSTATTTTCKTPGWFGCKDPTTTTTTATPAPSFTSTTSTITSTTTSCKDPGWFGCRDPTTTTNPEFSVTAPPTPPPTATSPSSSTTCETPGYIWGCYDSSTTTTSTNDHPITPAPTFPPPFAPTTENEDKCTKSVFFGLICWS